MTENLKAEILIRNQGEGDSENGNEKSAMKRTGGQLFPPTHVGF